MADEGISEEVRRFIAAYIDSVELLEILLLLRRDDRKEWSVESVSREVRSSLDSVAKRLTDLCARGLSSRTSSPHPLYIYRPKNKEVDSVVKAVAKAYTERRARVIDLIFSRPINTLRDFSDAFKIRKDEDNG